jgi:hypothetical protein
VSAAAGMRSIIQYDHFSQNLSYRLDLYASSRIVDRSTMNESMTTDQIEYNDDKNQDYYNSDNKNNKANKHGKNNKPRRLKSIILSTNVNDYDTGENIST